MLVRMSKLIEPPRVKLIIGLIFKTSSPIEKCIMNLQKRFGQVDFKSDPLAFDYTSYYEEEMGRELSRIIISYERLIKRDKLLNVKVTCSKLEQKYSKNGNREINIDPGYIAAEHLILATGKGFYHRPYLGKGVYADLTLVFKNKEFIPLEWTYPDYRTYTLRNLFKRIREKYMNELQKESTL